MPFPLVLTFLCVQLAEQRQDELAIERAAGEGMVERFASLQGINEPRVLSWAEERALREDLRQSVDLVYSRPGRTVYRYPVGRGWRAIYGSSGQ
jgi:hypothetical protein